MALNLAVGAVTLAIGIFVAVSPVRAARIWGWKHLSRLAPHARDLYFLLYRALDVLLSVAGVLIVLDRILAP
jgi:hypothetical protein